MILFFFKQKTAYEMRIRDWSSDVCSSDLPRPRYAASRRPRPPRDAMPRRPRPASRRLHRVEVGRHAVPFGLALVGPGGTEQRRLIEGPSHELLPGRPAV